MIVLAILAVAFFCTGPVLALIALFRAGRLGTLERRLIALEMEVSRLRQKVAGEPGKAAPAQRPEPRPAAQPTEQVSPPPARPATATPTPRVVGTPLPPAAAEPARSVVGAPPAGATSGETPTSPPAPFEWERWIGIRGAAILGAIALGLAGLLFFRYSIEHGLITPAMRVVLGTLAGVGALGLAQWLRPRGYAYTAEGLSGAGVVILYAAFWAAHVLYHLIGPLPAYALMILVTLACGLLAVRHSSLLVAVLGLVGGFATPLLLSGDTERPLGLFSYVLLLDLGLFVVARRRGWPALGLLGLAGTVLIEALWIQARMSPEQLPLGLLVLGVFALLFAAAGRLASPENAARAATLWTSAAGILFPFAFAVYFAARAELGERLWPIALLLAMLGAAASWIARERQAEPIALGAAGATLAVILVWLSMHDLTAARAWEVVAVCAALAVLFHLFCERDRARSPSHVPPAALLACGFFAELLFTASEADTAPWPWVACWTLLAILLYRQATLTGIAPLRPAATVAFALGLTLLHHAHASTAQFPPVGVFLLLLVAAPWAAHAVALTLRERDEALGDEATIALASLLLLGLAPAPFAHTLAPLAALATMGLVALAGVAAATRRARGWAYAIPVAALWIAQSAWSFAQRDLESRRGAAAGAFALEVLAVTVVTIWPLVAVRSFSRDRVAWYAAALAAPCWFPALRRLFEAAFGESMIGLLPLGLGALALAAATRVRRLEPSGDPVHMSALVWFSAVALSFAAIAVPLQLDKEWITIGWALQGVAILALWRRVDHPGLKYFALALFAAVSVRLVANPELLGYYPRSGARLVNWIFYTYLVSSGALLAGARLLSRQEVQRARPWEKIYEKGRPVGAIATGLAAVAIVFVWINLEIADWFAMGPTLTLSFGERPSQRLAVSIAWALYALVLLGCGMVRAAPALRWVSLGLLLVTLVKVFLYDLGSLGDLYRVASLLGLAISLIAVSLLYQRFVFRVARAGQA